MSTVLIGLTVIFSVIVAKLILKKYNAIFVFFASGIAIMLAVIVFHLFCANDGLWTDFIAIIGLIFVIKGYNTKDTDNESTE